MWKVVAAIGGLFGLGGIIFGTDQYKKRKQDELRFNAELKRKKAQLKDVEVRFGRQSTQFKIIAEELRKYKSGASNNPNGRLLRNRDDDSRAIKDLIRQEVE